jgi:hypothetical protein
VSVPVPVVDSPTVYILQTEPDGPVKIGFTRRRIYNRVAAGQTFSPDRIYVLAETYGTLQDETALHRRFKHLRVRGEWFRYGDEVQELVAYLSEGGSLQYWLHG